MLPDYIDPEAWDGFCEMRKLMGTRAPFTKLAERLTLRKLEDFYRQGYDVNHILETSIEKGYRGVFLGADTPRRPLKAEEKANVSKVLAMVGKAVKTS
jgi:hypothetical protein